MISKASSVLPALTSFRNGQCTQNEEEDENAMGSEAEPPSERSSSIFGKGCAETNPSRQRDSGEVREECERNHFASMRSGCELCCPCGSDDLSISELALLYPE